MTALAATASSPTHSFRIQSDAASETASKLIELLLVATSHARDHAADWRPLTKALIEKIAAEHSSPGWDGYAAKPISSSAKEYAQALIDLFPFDFPAPEPVADPDGDLALCWDFGPRHIFTLTVSPTGTLSYAGLLGEGGKRHGMEPFKGSIPKAVVDSVEELRDRTGVGTRTST